MKIIFVDKLKPLVDVWNIAFADLISAGNVQVIHGSIFDQKVDAIVSPANSFGFMDGGLDYHISANLGWDIQTNLQEYIKNNTHGELLVGQAVAISTTHNKIPFVISAPTMRVPTILGAQSINVYLATKAALHCMITNKLNSIAIPGMGTGVGKVPVGICASQMRRAYEDIFSGTFPKSWKDAQNRHQLLTTSFQNLRDLQYPKYKESY